MPLEPLADKYRAFNWHVLEVDGHNIREFVDACHEARSIKEKPTLILAHTTPGKGVAEIENDYRCMALHRAKVPQIRSRRTNKKKFSCSDYKKFRKTIEAV